MSIIRNCDKINSSPLTCLDCSNMDVYTKTINAGHKSLGCVREAQAKSGHIMVNGKQSNRDGKFVGFAWRILFNEYKFWILKQVRVTNLAMTTGGEIYFLAPMNTVFDLVCVGGTDLVSEKN